MYPLMRNFSDIFPEDLPPGLSPIRGIEHQIDLVPGALLPILLAYRYNLEEAKELQRQLQEIIARGYVRENMIPCSGWLNENVYGKLSYQQDNKQVSLSYTAFG